MLGEFSFLIRANFQVADVHVSLLSRENAVLLTRASEERAKRICQNLQLARVPRGNGSCLSQNRTSIRSLGSRRTVTDD